MSGRHLSQWSILALLRTACVTCIILTIFATICNAKRNNKLFIAGFFPTSTSIPEGAIGRGVIPAVNLALQHINNSPLVLRGYHLDIVYNDTKVNAPSCIYGIQSDSLYLFRTIALETVSTCT